METIRIAQIVGKWLGGGGGSSINELLQIYR